MAVVFSVRARDAGVDGSGRERLVFQCRTTSGSSTAPHELSSGRAAQGPMEVGDVPGEYIGHVRITAAASANGSEGGQA